MRKDSTILLAVACLWVCIWLYLSVTGAGVPEQTNAVSIAVLMLVVNLTTRHD